MDKIKDFIALDSSISVDHYLNKGSMQLLPVGNKIFISGFELAGNDINVGTITYRYNLQIEFDSAINYDNSIQTLIENASKVNRHIEISGYSKPNDLLNIKIENVGNIWANSTKKIIRGEINITVNWMS